MTEPEPPAKGADPLHSALLVTCCATVTLLVLNERFGDLPGALLACAAARWVVGLSGRGSILPLVRHSA